MLRLSRKGTLSLAALLIVLGSVASIWLITGPLKARAASNLPYNMTANGPYQVKGNTVVDAQGRQYLFHGLGRDGLEYSCTGDGPLDAAHLAYMGAGASSSAGTYWWGNTVRLPLSEGFWVRGATGYSCTAAQYQALVKQTINTLTLLKLNVIIDLQWVDAGGQSGQGGGPWPMPDADSVTFWTQIASAYSSYSNVLFELYNEPHPASWTCWQAGCSTTDTRYSNDCQCQKTFTYQGVGMQALMNAVRGTGVTNLAIVAGYNWGYDLSQISTNPITGTNIVYDTHPYPYAGKLAAQWDAGFGNFSATHAVISAESGEYDCQNSYENSLLSYFDTHQISWIGWAWTVQAATGPAICAYPQLVADYQGTPTASMGQAEYQHLLSYVPAGTQPPAPPSNTTGAPPSTPPGPVNKTWYFAEGRVGKGFRQYLTIENPSSAVCAANVQYSYTPDGSQPTNKTVSIAVNPYSRLTQSVNNDLGYKDTGTTAASVATVITVNATSTPSCTGLVAERPIYFLNFRGIASGTDVLGSTRLSTTYSFADVPGGAGTISYLTVLNPNTVAANVSVTYYANGVAVGTQTVVIPASARGTLAPSTLNLPPHVAAVLTSNQPVVAERPTYFSGVPINGRTVSGAYDIIGASSLASDWLFAEGYTSATTQEYLTIANVDPAKASANVTVTLKSKTGATQSFPLTVAANSQTIWNVNTNNTFAGSSPEVSAEVTSQGAKIIVQREMYFIYKHTLTNGRVTTSLGGTDVLGQVGPAAYSAYSFSEGYANTGYNDWLTIQNPTAKAESISITLVNGLGQSYVQTVGVPANARFTEDIASLVQNVFKAGTNSSANSFSMTVQTLKNGGVFVAERPLYINTKGTSGFGIQGGDDIIGYVGG